MNCITVITLKPIINQHGFLTTVVAISAILFKDPNASQPCSPFLDLVPASNRQLFLLIHGQKKMHQQKQKLCLLQIQAWVKILNYIYICCEASKQQADLQTPNAFCDPSQTWSISLNITQDLHGCEVLKSPLLVLKSSFFLVKSPDFFDLTTRAWR